MVVAGGLYILSGSRFIILLTRAFQTPRQDSRKGLQVDQLKRLNPERGGVACFESIRNKSLGKDTEKMIDFHDYDDDVLTQHCAKKPNPSPGVGGMGRSCGLVVPTLSVQGVRE